MARWRFLLLAATIAVAAQAKEEEGKKPVRHKDPTGKYSIALPPDWTAEARNIKDAVLAFEIACETPRVRATIQVHANNTLGDPRSRPRFERKGRVEQRQAMTSDVGQEPLPHLILHYMRSEDEAVQICAYRRIKGNGFTIFIDTLKRDYEGAAKEILEVARSLHADVEPWPPIPPQYEAKKKGRFLYLKHPLVKEKIKDIQKAVGKAEKSFAKFHGKLPPAERLRQILVHPDREHARPILARVAEGQSDFFLDVAGERLFIVPLNRDPKNNAGYLARDTHRLMFIQMYGSLQPRWIEVGEGIVARAELLTGKRLPNIIEGLFRALPNTLHPLRTVRKLGEKGGEEFAKHSFGYVCFFRAGPSKYRKAYKAFLQDFRKSGDPEAAEEKHIGVFDEDELKEKATQFIRYRLRMIKEK